MRFRVLFPLIFEMVPWLAALAETRELRPPGFYPRAYETHALVGARLFVKPDTILSNATIVIRDGLIQAVGREITVPPDARSWDCTGLTVYAGFIDPYLTGDTDKATGTESHPENDDEAVRRNDDYRAAGGPYFGIPDEARPAGMATTGHPSGSVQSERSMADHIPAESKNWETLRELGFTAANLVPNRGILRGSSAVANLGNGTPGELLLRPETAQHAAFQPNRGDAYPNSLMGVIALLRQTLLDATYAAGDSTNSNAKRTPANHPRYNPSFAALDKVLRHQVPMVIEPGSALMGHRALALAREFDIRIQLVSSGQEWRRRDLASTVAAAKVPYIVPIAFPSLPKFPEEDAWESISLDQWRVWDWAPENPAFLRSIGAEIALTTHGLGDLKEFRNHLRSACDRGLSETDALAALTTTPAILCGVNDRLGTVEAGKIANLTVVDGLGYFAEDSKVRSVWIAGKPYEIPQPKDSKKKEEKPAKEDPKKQELRALARTRVARDPASNRGVLTNPPAVFIPSATVWTCDGAGILTNASILVEGGIIRRIAIGQPEKLPEGTLVLDLPGIHVTPGLIDCHSHSMILDAVNETGLPSTAQCRIGDVVNSESDNIHVQLAGGLTVANLLHGSANPIGGQNCVIKLRDGADPDAMKLSGAPGGIKFALGENVKQSNWGEKFHTRFPQSRMGVATFYVNRFTAAQQYLATWKAWRESGSNAPAPRRDLELEAIGEILEGSRLIHCHSYRQDEILAFLRIMESFHVRVGTLQHILEGYKVADEIAKHGAGASSFADWWAYKLEVFDAIPYSGSLMAQRGVVVSFNSDSDDFARRLNLEAAKAVKYGGTSEAEALKFVTINPARQLGIEQRVGSLTEGKDADFAVWSGNPLDSQSVCLQTWIDGKKYFDRKAEPVRVAALLEERNALIARAKKLSGDDGEKEGKKAGGTAPKKFFERALETAKSMGAIRCAECGMSLQGH
jgi:imidazolonepropionase-like amidohydrolase